MKRFCMVVLCMLSLMTISMAGQPPGISLNPNGTSYIYPPFDSGNWTMTQGPEVGQLLHDHDGDDYYAQDWANGCFSDGEKVYAGISGTVLLNQNGNGNQDYYGNTVVIHDGETGFALRYAHLQEFNPNLRHGEGIAAGTYLGKVGHSGNSIPGAYCSSIGGRGGHLHIVLYKNVWDNGIRPVWNRTDFNSSGTGRKVTNFAARFGYTAETQLVKGYQNQTVYAIKDGRRHPVSWYVFNNQGWNFDKNRTVFNPVSIWQDWLILTYPEGSFHPPRNGSLVRGDQNQTVFLIQNNQKYAVTLSEFTCRNFHFSEVVTVHQEECDRYAPGLNPFNLTGCVSNGQDPSDTVAKQDMINRSRTDFRFGSAIEASFGKQLNWDTSWELRWMEFEFSGNRRVTIFHATAKYNRSIRLTGFTDPDTRQWQGWQ
jgi:hypothetical protein